jgi:hypothetical protein
MPFAIGENEPTATGEHELEEEDPSRQPCNLLPPHIPGIATSPRSCGSISNGFRISREKAVLPKAVHSRLFWKANKRPYAYKHASGSTNSLHIHLLKKHVHLIDHDLEGEGSWAGELSILCDDSDEEQLLDNRIAQRHAPRIIHGHILQRKAVEKCAGGDDE